MLVISLISLRLKYMIPLLGPFWFLNHMLPIHVLLHVFWDLVEAGADPVLIRLGSRVGRCYDRIIWRTKTWDSQHFKPQIGVRIPCFSSELNQIHPKHQSSTKNHGILYLRVWQFTCWWTLSIEKIHWYGWTRKIICLHFREIESRWKGKLYWRRINAAASAPADALSSDLFNNQIITSCWRGRQTIQFQSNISQISKSYFDSDIFIDWIWGKADPYLNEFEQQVVTWVWAWRWSGVEKHPDPPPLLLG